mgnify:FL=1
MNIKCICDYCKKDISKKKGFCVKIKKYFFYPFEGGLSGFDSLDLCPDCFNKIFEPVLSKRKQNEEDEK